MSVFSSADHENVQMTAQASYSNGEIFRVN